MKKLLFVLALLLAVPLGEVAAQGVHGLKFRRLDTRDGMSNANVYAILEDSHGFVWIGTAYGLNRFDGSRFRVFYTDASDSTAMQYDFVDGISETYDGNLLIRHGTVFGFFNTKTELFNYDITGWLHNLGLEGNAEHIYVDRKKNFWIKMFSDDIYCYNPYTDVVNKIRFGSGRYGFPANAHVSDFASHGDYTLVVTDFGDLLCLDGANGEVVWISSYVRKYTKETKGDKYMIKVAPNGNLWVIDTGRQFIYDQKSKRWYNSLKQYVDAMGYRNTLPDVVSFWDAKYDSHGRVWLATDQLGLLIVDPENKEVVRYTHDKTDPSSVSDETLARICIGSNDNVWIGTYRNGVNQCVTNRANITNLTMGTINVTLEDKAGNYWLGTNDKGVIKYNPNTRESVTYNTSNSGLKSNTMVCALADKDGSVWFGTYNGGLSHCVNGTFTTYTQDASGNGLANNNIWGLAQDGDGNIWVGTLGGGVQRIDAKTRQWTTFNTKTASLSNDYVSSMQYSPNGWIVVGTNNYYSLINPKDNSLVNNEIPQDSAKLTKVPPSSTQVIIDSRGLIWYASAAGLNVYDCESGRVTLYDQSVGLSGTNICSVCEDSQHGMWVVTEYGISYLRPNQQGNQWSFDIRNFSSRDGILDGPHNLRSSYLTSNGYILVGGNNGADVINAESVSGAQQVGIPIFSGIKIFDNEIRAGKEYDGRIVLDETINECRKVKLSYKDKQLTVQLASSQAIIGDNPRFLYQLEGFSEKWISTEPGNPNVTFSGLPASHYILHVKQLDERNETNGDESTLDIVIEPPFYLTWWAFLVYALIVFAVIFIVYRKVQSRIRLEQSKVANYGEQQQEAIKTQLYSDMGQELQTPFEDAFSAVDTMMAYEVDDKRYQKQVAVKSSLETLLDRVDSLLGMGGSMSKYFKEKYGETLSQYEIDDDSEEDEDDEGM